VTPTVPVKDPFTGLMREARGLTAKVLALAKAAGNKAARSKGAHKKKFKLTLPKLDMSASALSCWEDPSEPAVLYFKKKKKSGGVRPIFS
jgi:hypothetical protein